MIFAFLTSAHYAKSPEAKRTQAALGIKARRRIALSGTPILNRPIEIYPILSWLAPSEWPGDRGSILPIDIAALVTTGSDGT